MEEIFDTFDKDGNYLGTRTKSYCHSENAKCYHKTVWIWIINSKKEILVQKRSPLKKFMPEKWDMSSAGHVSTGEDFLTACIRETQEELGLLFKKEQFVFQAEIFSHSLKEFGQVYFLFADFSVDEVSLQADEVAQIQWFSYDEFIRLLYSTDFVSHDENYKTWLKENLRKATL
jgi:isopentenyldiphosphate isomerase